MRYIYKAVLAAGVIFALPCAALAQEAVTPAANADALFRSKDPKVNRNKQATYHIIKDLIEAGHWELADKWLTERYIQHNPLLGSGRENLRRFFTQVMKVKPQPITPKIKMKVIAVVAEGDYVVVSQLQLMRDARDPSKTYSTTKFNMWRFVDGKADEHWEDDVRDPADVRVEEPVHNP